MTGNRGAVLVTGASTGIGRAIVDRLAAAGFLVHAGARKEADLDSLGKLPGVEPVRIDVTFLADVERAKDAVKSRGVPLVAIVNNAGIAVAGPLVDVDDDDMLRQFDVNVFGVHRVTRAFLPMLLEAGGRVVMMSSDSGFFATPFFGPYCASKFALEGYADSLRRELAGHGVKVIVIQPGRVRTPIWDKGERLLERTSGSVFEPLAKKIGAHAIARGKEAGIDPAIVAGVVHDAIVARKPKTRYLVARSTFKYRLVKILPDAAVDRLVAKELERFR